MKKRLVTLLLAASLTASLFTGCGQTGSVADDQTNDTQEIAADVTGDVQNTENAQETVSDSEDHGVLYVSFPAGNIRIAINILAAELGYFEEEGVDVQQVNIMGMDALTAINGDGDELDVNVTGFVPDLQAIGSGYDLTVVGGTAVEGGAIITQKGNAANYQNADTVIDLDAIASAKVGYVRNESSWVITRQYLLDNGVAEDKIAALEDEESGSVSYYQDETSVAQAVQKGEIEIGFLPMEYALLYGDAYDLEVVAPAGDLQENYVCCREVTSQSRYEEKYDAFVAYERARIRAFEYYKQGETDDAVKQDVVNIVSNWSGKEADYVETYLYGGVTKFAVDPNSNGVVKYVEAANNSGLLATAGVDFGTYDITQNIDAGAYGEAISGLAEENPDDAFYAELLEQFNSDN